MKVNRITLILLTTLCLSIVLAACDTGPSPEEQTQISQAGETEQAAAQLTADAAEKARKATDTAATLTAQPTSTSTDTPVPTFTPTATKTPLPSDTPTLAPTATRTLPPAPSRTPAPTQPPVTPTQKPSASVYGSTGGPDGFSTTITCSRAGGNCTPIVPPGDVSFSFTLGSLPSAPWALFVPYGLSVERDGANVSDMYMTVDAGWLSPGRIVGWGSSRNFQTPGRYVIRSSGCMLITGVQCGWTTMAGTTVTFVIQP